MNKSNSIKYNPLETNDKTVLSEHKISTNNWNWKWNFYQEINQRKSCSKKLYKYVAAFDYIDKILIVLNATSSRA